MKRLIPLIMLTLLLVSCAKEDLPPTPPPPGGSVTVGRALAGMAAMPTWAAMPKNIAINPTQAFYGDGVVVSVSNYDYVYKKGYYFNSNIRTWEPFSLQGEVIQDWLKNSGVGSVGVDKNRFVEGDNYLVIYACNKISGQWECNGNKWMLVTFTVSSVAVIPEVAYIDQFVINAPVVPFSVQSANALNDNFEATQVIQYNARYKEPNGLTVVARVFDFDSRAELDNVINLYFAEIIQQGSKEHKGHKLALFLSETDSRVAVWTSGKQLVYIETLDPEAGNKEIIEAYLNKYPSDLS